MDFGLIKGILYLVGKDTGGQTRDKLDNFGLIGGLEDVVVDKGILAEESQLVFHVHKESADWDFQANHKSISGIEWIEESGGIPSAARWIT